MMQIGPRADYGICSENSGSWIVPAHNGGIAAEVRVRGVNPGTKYTLPETLHQATGFENAVRFLRALGPEGVPHVEGGWLRFSPHPVLREFPNHRVGYIRPVDKALDHISVGLLIKTVPGMDEQSCTEDLTRLLRHLEGQHADFHGGEVQCQLWAPPLVTLPDSAVVQALARAQRSVTGRDPLIGTEARRGAMGDSGVMAAAGVETCIFGPGVMHDVPQLRGEVPPDESISVRELVEAAQIMMLAAVDLCW
jgi:acetylornithine deacetylase/succinyl-diaminopimelate desuccinylase-like protein